MSMSHSGLRDTKMRPGKPLPGGKVTWAVARMKLANFLGLPICQVDVG
jgi:hypothetical protein